MAKRGLIVGCGYTGLNLALRLLGTGQLPPRARCRESERLHNIKIILNFVTLAK